LNSISSFSLSVLLLCYFIAVSVNAAGSDTTSPTLAGTLAVPSNSADSSKKQESSFFFQPRVWTGAMHLKHEQSRIIKSTDGKNTYNIGIQFESAIPMLGVGGVLVYEQFFLDGYVQKAFGGEDKQDFSTYEFEREDYAVSFGYNITDEFTAFVGYRTGQTIYDTSATGSLGSHYEFKTQGPLVGLNYTHPISNYGLVNFSVGYATLDGEYKESAGSKTENSSTGLTYGISWRGGFSSHKNLNYGISLDKYNYTFDELNTDSSDKKFKYTFNAKDEILTLKFTLSYVF